MARLAAGSALIEASYRGVVLSARFVDFKILDSDSSYPLQPSEDLKSYAHRDNDRGVCVNAHVVVADLDEPPSSTEDVYLRLYLLSARLVKPGEVNLEGAADILPLVAWSASGPIMVSDVPAAVLNLYRAHRPAQIRAVSKWPLLLDFYCPDDVAINPNAVVHLGAYLAPGTSVQAGAQVAANAGTLSPQNLVENLDFGQTLG